MTRLWYFHEFADFDLLVTGVTARRYLTSKKATLSPSTSHCRNMAGRFEEGRGKRKEEHREPHAPEPVLFMLDKECKEYRYIMYIYIYTHYILHVYSRYDILYIAFVSTDRCTDLNPGIVAFEFQIPGPPPLVCSLDITTAYLVIVFRIQPVRQI